ncbi:TetR/AcrR family transcriptional regulator [Streptomyces sp. NPDC048845]
MSTHTAGAAPTRREQILKEAARLFADRGFHGVGVDEIGAAVGISGPGLYRHFPGKDAMLAELLVGISSRLLTGGRRRVAETAGPAGDVLDSLIEGHIDFALHDRALITLHDRELDRLRESDRKLVRQFQRQYVELWVEIVRRVHARLTEAEARACVHAVFGLLNSTPHLDRPGALPGRGAMAALLHRLARGAFAAAAEPGPPSDALASGALPPGARSADAGPSDAGPTGAGPGPRAGA